LGLPFVLLLAACSAEARPAGETETPSPFADCAALTRSSSSTPPAAAPAASGPAASGPSGFGPAASGPAGSGPSASGKAGDTLPDVELPCFTGGGTVKLTELRGPAVVNLWASWCEPCRTELPAMQRLADRAGGKLTVVGVDTGDDRAAAASFGTDHQVAMPTLYDRDKKLISKLGRSTLPVTIFLSGTGSWHVEPLPLDGSKLDALVRTWTGVTVNR
jgi:thiol-disulfide isomerase/thioredoxin